MDLLGVWVRTIRSSTEWKWPRWIRIDGGLRLASLSLEGPKEQGEIPGVGELGVDSAVDCGDAALSAGPEVDRGGGVEVGLRGNQGLEPDGEAAGEFVVEVKAIVQTHGESE